MHYLTAIRHAHVNLTAIYFRGSLIKSYTAIVQDLEDLATRKKPIANYSAFCTRNLHSQVVRHAPQIYTYMSA